MDHPVESTISKRMNKKRIPFIILALTIGTIILISRLVVVQLVQKEKFEKLAAKQLEKVIVLPARRGSIYDQNGIPLALSTPVYSAYARPVKIANKTEWAKSVSWYLPSKTHEIIKKLNQHDHFVWIHRKLTPTQYEHLKRLDLEGLAFLKEEKRQYPHQELASQTLGFVGIDSQGLGGIEYQFDSQLRGKPGKLLLEGDPRGYQLVSGKRQVLTPAFNGDNIHLSLDVSIQYLAETYLAQGVAKTKALSGTVVVMNPNTGAVVALASSPNFNPNQWQRYPAAHRRSTIATDVYEPGSVFKLITLAAVLEEGVVTPETVLAVPETLSIANKTVKEAHDRKEGETDQKSVTEILKDSLNVGTTLLAQQLGEDKFFRYIQHFGFGRPTRIGLPGETAGLVRSPDSWSAVDIATFSYGQGIGVSAIQMATAVSAIVNGGMLIQPSIIQRLTNDLNTTHKQPSAIRKQRVLSRLTASEMVKMMVSVVDDGTAKIVRIPGYAIGGKTGTAQKPSPKGGYLKGQYIASFVGFFPANRPEYVVLVCIDSPKTSIWGSSVAGPIFRDITKGIISYKQIEPDRPEQLL